jgi:ribose 5-phosphate isomerase A
MTMQAGSGDGHPSMTDPAVESAAASALELIRDGMRVGLGTGHGAAAFLARLADRVRSGLRVVGVPTSEATAAEARRLGIPLGTLDDDQDLALTVDGADEVAPNLDLVKGFGGALARERIVAAASRRQVIVIGNEKLVDWLGTRGRIPIEVLPFACGLVVRRVRGLGLDPVVRRADGRPLITDNGNLTIDCGVATPLADARAARVLEADLRAIPGVVDTGLFLGTAERVLVGHPDGHVDVLQARR